MLWVYSHYKYSYSYSAGIDFDVYRRQILMANVDTRCKSAKLINICKHLCLKAHFKPINSDLVERMDEKRL